MANVSDISLVKAATPSPAIPGVRQGDMKKLRRCERSDPLLAAAIARSDWRTMEAVDHKRWTSIAYARRWSRNIDGIMEALAAGKGVDIYWSDLYGLRTRWRIVQRERVDGFIQSTLFESAGIQELRAEARSAVEALELHKAVRGQGLQSTSQSGRLRL